MNSSGARELEALLENYRDLLAAILLHQNGHEGTDFAAGDFFKWCKRNESPSLNRAAGILDNINAEHTDTALSISRPES